MQHVSTYNSHLQAKLRTVNAYRVVDIMLMQHVSTYNSHLQAKLRTVNAYRVVDIMLMQHVSTYNSHLQAKLRTVNALQGGCAHLGSNMAYSVIAVIFLRT